MILLAVVYFLVFAVPLFFGSFRTAVVSLGLQAIVLAVATAREAHGSWHAFEIFQLGVVRGVLVPVFLLATVARPRGAANLEPIRGDALHWTLVLALVVASATFGAEVAADSVPRAFGVAAAAAEVLIGFLMLATHSRPLGQVLGALSIENGALFMDARATHHFEAPVQIGITAVFVLLVLQLAWFAQRLEAVESGGPAPAGRDEVL